MRKGFVFNVFDVVIINGYFGFFYKYLRLCMCSFILLYLLCKLIYRICCFLVLGDFLWFLYLF